MKEEACIQSKFLMIFFSTESTRKDDPPKLTLRPDLGPQTLKFSSRQRSRPATMPELKRIKREQEPVVAEAGESMEPGEVPHSPSPVPSSHNSEDPQLNHATKIKVKASCPHDDKDLIEPVMVLLSRVW